MLSAAKPVTFWLLLWKCQLSQNKGRGGMRQPQTKAPGALLTAKSGSSAEATAIALSNLHTEGAYYQTNID